MSSFSVTDLTLSQVLIYEALFCGYTFSDRLYTDVGNIYLYADKYRCTVVIRKTGEIYIWHKGNYARVDLDGAQDYVKKYFRPRP